MVGAKVLCSCEKSVGPVKIMENKGSKTTGVQQVVGYLELSNAAGSFAAPTTIGSVSSTTGDNLCYYSIGNCYWCRV
jgi:hypothetical protein